MNVDEIRKILQLGSPLKYNSWTRRLLVSTFERGIEPTSVGSLPFGMERTQIQYQSKFSLLVFSTFGPCLACSMDTVY